MLTHLHLQTCTVTHDVQYVVTCFGEKIGSEQVAKFPKNGTSFEKKRCLHTLRIDFTVLLNEIQSRHSSLRLAPFYSPVFAGLGLRNARRVLE